MATSIVCYNSKFYPEDEVPLKFNNRAFKFGDSFFETIRCNDSQPLHFDEHYKRIIKALISLQMNIASLPKQIDLEFLITKLVKQNKQYSASRVRLEIFRAGEGLYTPNNNNVEFVIECSKLDNHYYSLNEKGLLLGDYTDVRKDYNPISYFKSGNSLPYVLAALAKKEHNTDDCFIYNNENKIIEASSSNLFWIKDSIIYTPSIYSGCVAGVMRSVLINLIKKENIAKVIETNGISSEALYGVDEIFLCNAVQGIQWVVGYGEKRFFNHQTKKIHQLLNRTYIK